MVEQKICTFCGASIEPGTGKMYVKKDGTTYLFCSNKCSKNMIEMGRVPRKVTWTAATQHRKGLATEARNLKAAESAPKEELAPVEQQALRHRPRPRWSRQRGQAGQGRQAQEGKEGQGSPGSRRDSQGVIPGRTR